MEEIWLLREVDGDMEVEDRESVSAEGGSDVEGGQGRARVVRRWRGGFPRIAGYGLRIKTDNIRRGPDGVVNLEAEL